MNYFHHFFLVGSLGLLEDWAARIAALQRTTKPKASEVACLIFAADHGVAKDKTEGGMNCSAYPQIVSRKVLEGLDAGIAGASGEPNISLQILAVIHFSFALSQTILRLIPWFCSVLSKCNNVALRVIDVGLADGQTEHQWSGNVVRSSEFKVRGGTSNFCTGNAMTGEEVEQCISVGRNETGKIMNETGASVIVFGEVGIGNTTTSSALIAALTGAELESMCGSGASTSRDGINDEIVSRKIAILKEAMQYHGASNMLGKPKNALKFVGGAEITAIIGGMLEASDRDVPILVDGFIVTTAAMIACELDPAVCRVLLFATQSTEKGQEIALDAIASFAKNNDIPHVASPALNMNLRMGEATGALAAVPLVRSACAIMSELATLDEVLGLEAKS